MARVGKCASSCAAIHLICKNNAGINVVFDITTLPKPNTRLAVISDTAMPSPLIIFKCPRTGLNVQTYLAKEATDNKRRYEAVACPACTQFHSINTSTGKLLGKE